MHFDDTACQPDQEIEVIHDPTGLVAYPVK